MFKVVRHQFSSVRLPAQVSCHSVQFGARGQVLWIQFVLFQVHPVQYMVFVSDVNSVHYSNYFKSLFSSTYLPDWVSCNSVQFIFGHRAKCFCSVQFMNSSGPGTWVLVGKLLVHIILPEKGLWFKDQLPSFVKTKLLNALWYPDLTRGLFNNFIYIKLMSIFHHFFA